MFHTPNFNWNNWNWNRLGLVYLFLYQALQRLMKFKIVF